MYFFEAIKKRGLLSELEFVDVQAVQAADYRQLIEKYLADYTGETPFA